MSDKIPLFYIKTTNKHLTLRVKNHIQPHLEPLLKAPAHRRNMHEILLVVKGKAEHTVDMDTYWVEEQSLCLIAKGQVHDYHAFEDYEIWALFFLEDMLPEHLTGLILALFSLQAQHHFRLSQDEFRRLEILMQEMNRLLEKDTDSYAKDELLQHYLSAMLLLIERIRHKNFVRQHDKKLESYELTQSFLALLEKHAKEEHGVNFYAGLLQVSPRKLSEVTQDVLGKRTKVIIEEHLNLEAKRMLRFTSLNAQEVAYDLGFDDPSYFTRFFKKYNTVAPSEFRKKARV